MRSIIRQAIAVLVAVLKSPWVLVREGGQWLWKLLPGAGSSYAAAGGAPVADLADRYVSTMERPDPQVIKPRWMGDPSGPEMTCWLWALAVEKNKPTPDIRNLPGPVQRWLASLLKEECKLLASKPLGHIARHLSPGSIHDRIAGLPVVLSDEQYEKAMAIKRAAASGRRASGKGEGSGGKGGGLHALKSADPPEIWQDDWDGESPYVDTTPEGQAAALAELAESFGPSGPRRR